MTREEQLACLEDRPCSVCKFHTDRCNSWTCVFEDEPEEQDPCEDAISRQAVLDAIEELKKIHFDRVVVLNKVRDRVLGLPPVNPTPNISIQITEREKYGRFN